MAEKTLGKGFGLALFSASLALTSIFLAYYQVNPSIVRNADAWGYVFQALRFRQSFPLDDFGSVRTYGYPLFLYALTFLSGFNPDRLALITGATQAALYLAAAGWLVWQFAPLNRKLALACFIGLALNPVLLSSVTDVLTEGMTLVAFVAMLALALKASRDRNWKYIALGCVVAMAAIMVRPGNIVLVIAWYMMIAITAVASMVTARQVSRSLLNLALWTSIGTAVGGLVILGPQIAYNFRNFSSLTFFPTCQLGPFQLYTSAFMWKYDTLVTDGAASGLIYVNPIFAGTIDSSAPWLWYLQNPVAGIATLAAHVFNLFSVTTLFTYIRELHPVYELPMRGGYWALMLVGFYQCARTAFTSVRMPWDSKFATLVFAALCLAGFVALGSISAVEQRFGVVPIAIVSVAGLYAISGFKLTRYALVAAVVLCVLTAACVGISYRMDQLSGRGFDGLDFQFTLSDTCKVTLDGKSWDEMHADFDEMVAAP